MVAGGPASLRISDPPKPSNSIIGGYMQLGCVIIYTNMALWCIINSHGLLACTPVLDWYDSKIWVPVIDFQAFISHLIPNSDQSHNMYLECFFMKINNCHLCCWRPGYTPAAVSLRGVVNWSTWKTKSRQWKATVQKLFWGSPGTPFNCKLAMIKLRLRAPGVWEVALRIAERLQLLWEWRLCSKLTLLGN